MKKRVRKGKKINKDIEVEKVTEFDKVKNIKDNSIAFRVRRFKENITAHRKQLVIDVLHPNKPRLSNSEIQNQICKMFGVDKGVVFVFAMRTTYDGNRSNGFALIYNNAEFAKQYEPRHRLRK
ncbi:9178_t:CDS:2 [Entrophospora sp. SA101]|nr:9178_t:CDS:2 [Entrophospora sp. SA101]